MKNSKLRDALFRKGMTQEKLSKDAMVPCSYISLHINGRFLFNKSERQRIAKALGVEESEIFEQGLRTTG